MKALKILMALFLLTAIIGSFMPLRMHHGLSARNIALSNTKEVTFAIFMYQSDNEDLFPRFQWRPLLLPYLKDSGSFEQRKGEAPYILAHRATLIGKRASTIREPQKTVMLLDVEESSDPYVAELPATAFRRGKNTPEETALMAFADGSARRIGPEAFKAAR